MRVHRKISVLRIGFLILLLGMAGAAFQVQAQDDEGYGYPPGLGATVTAGGYHTDFAYPDGSHEADVSRYGISVSQAASPWVDLGLEGGLLILSVNNATLAPATDNGGRYLGLFADWHTDLGNYLGLEGRVSYSWNDDDFQAPNQQAQVTWYQSYVSLGPSLRVQNWRFSAGGYWQRYNGSETDNGGVTGKQDFSAARRGGVYAGFAYYVDRTGSIGLYASRGGRNGVQLVFRREY